MRDDQRQLVTAVLARLRGERADPLTMTIEQFRLAGLATGLTALLGELDPTTSSPLSDDASIQAHIDEQREQVRVRVERFLALKERVVVALADADVPAVFVKGAELIDGVWSHPSARPMADLDVVVAPHLRAQAGAALVAAGCTWWTSTPYEDAFLGWGDGGTGRLDGESADHNGRVEVHPGWLEFVHGYEVAGFDVIGAARPTDGRLRLPLDALTAEVVGHLGATVVRAEVRALNAVDTWFCDRRGVDWQDVSRPAQPGRSAARRAWPVAGRPTAPGHDSRDGRRSRTCAVCPRLPGRCWTTPSRRTCSGIRRHGPISGGDRRSPSARERFQVVEQMVWPSPRRSIAATVERVAARGLGTRLAT